MDDRGSDADERGMSRKLAKGQASRKAGDERRTCSGVLGVDQSEVEEGVLKRGLLVVNVGTAE